MLVEVRGIVRRLQLGQLLAIGGLERVDLEARAAQLRLGLVDGNLVRLRIDPEQQLPPLDALIILTAISTTWPATRALTDSFAARTKASSVET